MKAIILAAGEGIRMRPLTLDKPKPMVEVGGLPIIHHILSQLPPEIDEFIIVTGYLGKQIQDYLGDEFMGRKISYVWQKGKRGTYNALEQARHLLNNEPFATFFSDDIIDKETIQELIKCSLAVIATEVSDPKPFGVIVSNPDGTVAEIEEKPALPKSNLAVVAGYILTSNIFNYAPPRQPNGEFYITHALNKMAKEHSIRVVKTKIWIPISTPEDLKKAENSLRSISF